MRCLQVYCVFVLKICIILKVSSFTVSYDVSLCTWHCRMCTVRCAG